MLGGSSHAIDVIGSSLDPAPRMAPYITVANSRHVLLRLTATEPQAGQAEGSSRQHMHHHPRPHQQREAIGKRANQQSPALQPARLLSQSEALSHALAPTVWAATAFHCDSASATRRGLCLTVQKMAFRLGQKVSTLDSQMTYAGVLGKESSLPTDIWDCPRTHGRALGLCS